MKFLISGGVLFLFTFSLGAGTFVENFDDGELEAWSERVKMDAAPGFWTVVDGELQATSHGGFTRLLTTGDETWQDYVIEFDVQPLKKHGPGNIAIAARITGALLMHCAIGDMPFPEPESKATSFGGNFHKEAGLRLFHTERAPFLKLNKWSTMKLSVNGKNFGFWINDKKIMETGDPFIFLFDGQEHMLKTKNLSGFPRGGAGFGLTNYTARFDNITITGDSIPTRGGLSVSPRAKLATTWGSLKRF